MVPNLRKDENQQLIVKQLTENRQENNWVTKKTQFFRKLFKPKMICSTIRWNFVVNFWRLDNKNVVPDFNLKRPPLFHLTLNWQRKISNVPIACQTSQLQNIKKYDWLIDNQMVEKNLRQQQNKDDDFCVRQVVHTQFFLFRAPLGMRFFNPISCLLAGVHSQCNIPPGFSSSGFKKQASKCLVL